MGVECLHFAVVVYVPDVRSVVGVRGAFGFVVERRRFWNRADQFLRDKQLEIHEVVARINVMGSPFGDGNLGPGVGRAYVYVPDAV